MALPVSNTGNDALLTVTDKFSKYIKLIPGKTTFTAKDWATKYFTYIFKNWGSPQTVISDHDPKFTGDFWQEVFRTAKVHLALTTAYHPQADGQSERTNQTVETALRCLLVSQPGSWNWEELLPEVEYALNTSTNTTTNETPFKLLYGIEP